MEPVERVAHQEDAERAQHLRADAEDEEDIRRKVPRAHNQRPKKRAYTKLPTQRTPAAIIGTLK